MFPLVPYHALPRLHELVKADMPKPYAQHSGRRGASLLPAVLRQRKDPGLPREAAVAPAVRRAERARHVVTSQAHPDAEGWVEVCERSPLPAGGCPALRPRPKDLCPLPRRGGRTVRHRRHLHARQHPPGRRPGQGRAHRMPQAQRTLPPGRRLARPRAGLPRAVHLSRRKPRRQAVPQLCPRRRRGSPHADRRCSCAVVSNRSVATFIKELVFEPGRPGRPGSRSRPATICSSIFRPTSGIRFRDFDIPQPYAAVWESAARVRPGGRQSAPGGATTIRWPAIRRAKSILRFNVRIATPPPGQDCPPGVGSAYMFQPQAGRHGHGDRAVRRLSTSSPRRRKWCTSAAARAWPRCAPICRICSRPSKTARKVSFWYGARSRQELFYQDYFEGLAARFPNFRFHLALSAPLPEDDWAGPMRVHPRGRARSSTCRPTEPRGPWNTICAARR